MNSVLCAIGKTNHMCYLFLAPVNWNVEILLETIFLISDYTQANSRRQSLEN